MKKTRLIALVLALMLVLASCGGSGSNSGSTPEGGAASSGAVDATLDPAALDDVVKYLTDGAYTKDSVVGHVGDREITAGQVLYWIAYQQYNMTYYYTNYFGFTLNMSDPMDDNTTVGQSLYQFGLDTALSYAVAAQHARDNGVELSEEDAALVGNLYQDNVNFYGEDRWNAYVQAGLLKEEDFSEEEKAEWMNTHGEDFYHHSMMYYGTTAQDYETLISDFYYYNTLQEQLFGEGGAQAPTEATINDYMTDYINENGVVWARCILFPTADLDDAGKADMKAQADAVMAELSALSGEELSNAFTEQQTAHDKSGYAAGEVQHYTNTDSLVDGFYDGITKLQPGQLGMTDETDYGYFILLREDENRSDLTELVTNEYVSTTYDSLIAQWTKEYDAKCEMPDLDLDSFYEKLGSLQKTLAVVDTVNAASDSKK